MSGIARMSYYAPVFTSHQEDPMGLIDRLFRRTRQDKSTPARSGRPSPYVEGQYEGAPSSVPSRRARHKKKAARKRTKQSRRVNR